MSKTLYYPSEVDNMIDVATAQLVREIATAEKAEEKNDCPLQNTLKGIFALGDKIKSMISREE